MALLKDQFKEFGKNSVKSSFFLSISLECGLGFHLMGKESVPHGSERRADSPFMKPPLRFLQLGLQVPHSDLFLLQRRQILFWVWRLDTVIFTTGHVPSRAPETIQAMKCSFFCENS